MGKDQSRNRYNDNRSESDKYVGAPYNFVPMWKTVAELNKKTDTISHDCVSNNLISGVIDYCVTAKTPIIVDNGNGDFVKNNYGEYVIPGSSMCGLIRNNVQILSQSSLADDIDDYSLMFREVGGAVRSSMNKSAYDGVLGSGTVQLDGKSLSVLKNVKAGYIKNTGKEYIIYHTKPDRINNTLGEMNYYVLSERKIVDNYLKSKEGRESFRYSFFMQNGKSIMQHEFKQFIKVEQGKRTEYRGTDRRGEYKPYMCEVSYDISDTVSPKSALFGRIT